MRLNQFLAQNTLLSRRSADEAIAAGRVTINGQAATLGQQIDETDRVELDNELVELKTKLYLVMNKPEGYVCSRAKQGGAPTIYDLLPSQYQHLKYVGRLDKDSCGLLLLTNDGQLAQKLSHPSNEKLKVYQIRLNGLLQPAEAAKIQTGVELEDGPSRLNLDSKGRFIIVSMHEGRNRQIRRTFAALGRQVTFLQRLQFGRLKLGDLKPGEYKPVGREKVA